MTTDLRVRLHATAPFGAALRVRDARAAVRPSPDDGRYWDTAVVASTEAGRSPPRASRSSRCAAPRAAWSAASSP